MNIRFNFFLANDKRKVLDIIKEAVDFVSTSHGLHVPLQYKVEVLRIVKKEDGTQVSKEEEGSELALDSNKKRGRPFKIKKEC